MKCLVILIIFQVVNIIYTKTFCNLCGTSNKQNEKICQIQDLKCYSKLKKMCSKSCFLYAQICHDVCTLCCKYEYAKCEPNFDTEEAIRTNGIIKGSNQCLKINDYYKKNSKKVSNKIINDNDYTFVGDEKVFVRNNNESKEIEVRDFIFDDEQSFENKKIILNLNDSVPEIFGEDRVSFHFKKK